MMVAALVRMVSPQWRVMVRGIVPVGTDGVGGNG
jgi:hypothetical protein